MRRNGDVRSDNSSEREQRRRVLAAAVRQLERAFGLQQNCQVVFNISRGGTIKAKITLDIDLDEIGATEGDN